MVVPVIGAVVVPVVPAMIVAVVAVAMPMCAVVMPVAVIARGGGRNFDSGQRQPFLSSRRGRDADDDDDRQSTKQWNSIRCWI